MVQNMFSRRKILSYTQCFNDLSIRNREKMEGRFLGFISSHSREFADLPSYISLGTPLL